MAGWLGDEMRVAVTLQDAIASGLRVMRVIMYLLGAYSPVNLTGSPQGFALNQILHKWKTIQNM